MSTIPEYEPRRLLKDAKERQERMVQELEALVSVESPSENKGAVDRASHLVAGWFEELGGKIRWHRQKQFGDLLEARFGAMDSRPRQAAGARQKPILLLGHLDTVWPMGTLATMPFRKAKGKLVGPGVYDMKAGVVMALHALAMLREAEVMATPVVVLLNSEEEVGSPVSRAVTEKIALECSKVFVLEPAQG
ncbi:MAG: M20/M25/M40 family metallo-hydrolase, partial [Terriglobia bacterium]|nr:M20/M25/M40 family metallo-hydrolase [Terriglobia bacterium]